FTFADPALAGSAGGIAWMRASALSCTPPLARGGAVHDTKRPIHSRAETSGGRMRLSCHSALAVENSFQRRPRVLGKMIRLGVRWILVRLDVRAKRMRRVADQRSGVGIMPNEFRGRTKSQIEEIVENQHLPVALRTRSNANCGRAHLDSDHCGDFPGNAFEVDAGYSGAVESGGVAHELLHRRKRFALHLVTTHYVNGLRGQTDVAGDRNFGVDNMPDEIGAFLSAFDLHRFGPAFFYKPSSVTHGLFYSQVVGAIRHVGDEQSMLDATAHSLHVVQHFVDGDGKRVVVSQHSLRERIANQDDVDCRVVNQAGTGVVVSSQAGDGLVVVLSITKRSNRDLLARFANRGETHDVLQCPSASGG